MDRMNQHYRADAFQRTKVCDWIKEVKSGRKYLSNITPSGRAADDGLNDCIARFIASGPASVKVTMSFHCQNYQFIICATSHFRPEWLCWLFSPKAFGDISGT
jgi:hypothetical protein